MNGINDAFAHHLIREISAGPARPRPHLDQMPVPAPGPSFPAFRLSLGSPLAMLHRATRHFAAPEPACCASTCCATA